jgi:hypothetical protein
MDVGLDAVGPLEVRVEVASKNRVWRGSVSHVVRVPAVVLEIPDEDGPVVCGEAEASSVVAERELAAVVESQEQLVAVGGWGAWADPAIGRSVADLYVYTLVSHSSGIRFPRIRLTGRSIGYIAMVLQDLHECVWFRWVEVLCTCFSPVELLSGSPQQLLLPFLRYRLNVIFEGNSVVGACLTCLYVTKSLLMTVATRDGAVANLYPQFIDI